MWQKDNKKVVTLMIEVTAFFCYNTVEKIKIGGIMFSYLNLNPKGMRVGDCVVRAISKALNKSWETTYIELSIQGLLMGDLIAANSVWGEYLKSNGFTRMMIPNDCPQCYCIQDFAMEHPTGTYVLGTGTHATVVIDGVIYDIWNCGEETPLYYYEKNEV